MGFDMISDERMESFGKVLALLFGFSIILLFFTWSAANFVITNGVLFNFIAVGISGIVFTVHAGVAQLTNFEKFTTSMILHYMADPEKTKAIAAMAEKYRKKEKE